jgi:hypothetical protein
MYARGLLDPPAPAERIPIPIRMRRARDYQRELAWKETKDDSIIGPRFKKDIGDLTFGALRSHWNEGDYLLFAGGIDFTRADYTRNTRSRLQPTMRKHPADLSFNTLVIYYWNSSGNSYNWVF